MVGSVDADGVLVQRPGAPNVHGAMFRNALPSPGHGQPARQCKQGSRRCFRWAVFLNPCRRICPSCPCNMAGPCPTLRRPPSVPRSRRDRVGVEVPKSLIAHTLHPFFLAPSPLQSSTSCAAAPPWTTDLADIRLRHQPVAIRHAAAAPLRLWHGVSRWLRG
ncbi:hypothetical protein K402DRAFT_189299 [Aulographum hederae CBS 113979]|uniref:Uncharacterized protein n=1 Tax=Aulographum hederae CBS 113979 TaxID=1176131 RepID=A0A6G1GPT6_9PEZI|nr:hypothetical protein K402DRAFT_189299 [Aulographum hederae CBS 113979]